MPYPIVPAGDRGMFVESQAHSVELDNPACWTAGSGWEAVQAGKGFPLRVFPVYQIL